MQITYKFRLYPTPEQEQKLLWTLEKCRLVYNDMLEGLNRQEKPNKLELQSTLPKLKEKYPELKEVYSKVLQHEVYRLFSNLRALAQLKKNGKKVGRLRFKGKGWFKTFTYNQSGFELRKTGKRLDRLWLSKIGENCNKASDLVRLFEKIGFKIEKIDELAPFFGIICAKK
jgi:putative transposase